MLGALLQKFAVDYNYDYSSPSAATNDVSAAGAGIVLFFVLLAVACVVVAVVAHWKIFTKARKPGWASIVPIYNIIVLLRIIGRPWWWFFLLCIPFVNVVIAIIVTNDMSKSFGKDTGWTLGLLLLPLIFYPMLAFGKAKYVGPAAGK